MKVIRVIIILIILIYSLGSFAAVQSTIKNIYQIKYAPHSPLIPDYVRVVPFTMYISLFLSITSGLTAIPCVIFNIKQFGKGNNKSDLQNIELIDAPFDETEKKTSKISNFLFISSRIFGASILANIVFRVYQTFQYPLLPNLYVQVANFTILFLLFLVGLFLVLDKRKQN